MARKVALYVSIELIGDLNAFERRMKHPRSVYVLMMESTFTQKILQVRSISLVKFKTPQVCSSIGGVMANRNDRHWEVLINDTILIYFNGKGLSESEWIPSNNSPRPCVSYTFRKTKTISIRSADIVTKYCSCHEVCKKIFKLLGIDILTGKEIAKDQATNSAMLAGGVGLAAFSIILSGGLFVLALGSGVLLSGKGISEMMQPDGHDGCEMD